MAPRAGSLLRSEPGTRTQYLSTELVLSATDRSNFLGCRHRTSLEMDAAAMILNKPQFTDPLLELLFARGLAREKAYVDELQVSRLLERLPDGVHVGTVDKFQAQQAPVVIYIMSTSRAKCARSSSPPPPHPRDARRHTAS